MELNTWQESWRVAAIILGSALLGAGGLHLYRQRHCNDLHFVRREYACETHAAAVAPSYTSVENEVRALLGREQARGSLTRASVHFQRLRDGSDFQVNETATFAPASLLKLPAVFALFVLEERTPGTLQTKMLYAPEQVRRFEMPSQIEVAAHGLKRGEEYPIETLMRVTITHSDNLAYYLLLTHLNDDPERAALLTRTFRELGIQDPSGFDARVASVREYAALFRTLYNASYLDARSSDKLLSWLGESTYDKSIARGLAQGVVVANKFGERILSDGSRELHDCGIVFESEPYVLCVMTQGKDFAALQDVIADVSATIYEDASARRP
jgi:beta-lactamase class A